MNLQQLKKIVRFYARFTLSFTQVGYAWRRLGWGRLTPGYAGQHWVVTGASGGIGGHIATEAARHGALVTAVARSPDKLARLVADARAASITGVDTEQCDLALQRDVHALLGRLAAAGRKVDVLVNNVGVLLDDHSLTAEGRETSYGTNLLNHYLLTEGLIRRGVLGQGAVVINMTSGGAYNVPLSTAFLNLTDPKTFNGTAAYGFHKRAQIVLTTWWRRKYGPRGITFYVMHPGWSDTDGVKRSLPRFRKILHPVLRDSASGADTALWLAAKRPPQRDEDCVWFDRATRPAHVYPETRVSKETPESLVRYLEADLARFPEAGLPA
jgi:dehydrogenase/reductase SDR family protein 12